jgi:hypothetical protein
MLEKISYTWSLMGASWDVLKRDPRLIVFPLLSGICCILVMLSFVIPVFYADGGALTLRDGSAESQVVRYVLIFSFYVANYFVIAFFNTAIIACAIARMAGGEPTIGGGFAEAIKRIHLIFGWALISATVGLIIRMIEERSQLVGRIIASIAGGAWTVLSFLVIPVLVVENKGPVTALKESASLFRKTWGEQLVGSFSFGLLFFVLGVPGWVLMFFGGYIWMVSKAGLLAGSLAVLGVFYLIVLALVQSALQSIFQAAVYMYTQGVTGGPQGFPVQLLRDAMQEKM